MTGLQLRILLFTLIFLACLDSAYGQGFRGIVPLRSNCEDVERILKVGDCNGDQESYRLPDYDVNIEFVTLESQAVAKTRFNVPVGTVFSIKVSYRTPIKIIDFEIPLENGKPLNDDIGTVQFGLPERGITVFAIGEYVGYVLYGPTFEDLKKYRCRPD